MMYLQFAWRYFRSKKSTNAINIIARVALGVIIFATCCQLLVLSVYNGFEAIVLDSYTAFYSDIKVLPRKGKTFIVTPQLQATLLEQPAVLKTVRVLEEKALLQYTDFQAPITVKAVDTSYASSALVPQKLHDGVFELGDSAAAKLVVGSGIKNALGLSTGEEGFGPSKAIMFIPKSVIDKNDLLAAISESEVGIAGAFSIQVEFDSKYVFADLGFLQKQLGLSENAVGAIEITLQPNAHVDKAKEALQKTLGKDYTVLSKFEQNMSLYQTLRMEKWAIYAVLSLILVIAAFNIVSALTMLVIEKQKDISLLKSIGASDRFIQNIFLSEGLLLGILGAAAGLILALIVAFLENKYQFLPIDGETFAIDYFPVSITLRDMLLVSVTSIGIACLAAIFPAAKAAKRSFSLK